MASGRHTSAVLPKYRTRRSRDLTSASVEFSKELRRDVLAGDITLSFRLWRRPKVKVGGRYPVGPGTIEVDSVESVPFSSISPADLGRSGESDLEALRQRAAHSGPIADDTMLYRVEFHVVDEALP
jgi:hypothetical protein